MAAPQRLQTMRDRESRSRHGDSIAAGDVGLDRGVEGARRLVEDEDLRAADEGASEQDALHAGRRRRRRRRRRWACRARAAARRRCRRAPAFPQSASMASCGPTLEAGGDVVEGACREERPFWPTDADRAPKRLRVEGGEVDAVVRARPRSRSATSPSIALISVDLPEPDGPARPMCSPGAISSERSSITSGAAGAGRAQTFTSAMRPLGSGRTTPRGAAAGRRPRSGGAIIRRCSPSMVASPKGADDARSRACDRACRRRRQAGRCHRASGERAPPAPAPHEGGDDDRDLERRSRGRSRRHRRAPGAQKEAGCSDRKPSVQRAKTRPSAAPRARSRCATGPRRRSPSSSAARRGRA